MKLFDSFNRQINYLRLSITDRCNLRCQYCMPDEGVCKASHDDVLCYEDLLKISRAAVNRGIEKIRVTGGEPLVRKGIVDFISKLSDLSGLKELVLTTNGILLEEYVADLKKAGLQRLNISLDSLNPQVFKQITRRGALEKVLCGIEAAERVGFPIKINMVVMRGVNNTEIADFVAMTLDKPISVRFIEYMPTANEENWRELVVPGSQLLDALAKTYTFSPLPHSRLAGPSSDFQVAGGKGTFGVITAVSDHFCSGCNRIRVTAEGKVRSCLFSDDEIDLKPFLQDKGEDGLEQVLQWIVRNKPQRPGLNLDHNDHTPFLMAAVGG